MKTIELQVTTRTIVGKKVKSLRNEGFIPAEIYGHKIENKHISVSKKQFLKAYKEAGENTIVTLLTDDGKKIPTFISDVGRDAFGETILSIDFHTVHMDEKIKAKVPIEFSGIAPALKLGHVVVKVLQELEVEALPQNMPHRFDADLSLLELPGQSIHISDMAMPKDIKIFVPLDTVIATVSEKIKEEVVEAPPVPTTQIPAEGAGAPETTEEKTKSEE